ncbi:ATP-binding cassette domain-containing protein [Aliarcobacter butzleri]|uniref:ATP-binding cassette domain-containing protein n=1 Tax=Aliarcobacter butzleri TaxID=28197 RepID=A0AAW7QAH3_9BACT|nr:ATP-binding cassette domain-containing protein [Aliarcobacter butzleri]MDN5107729.1 ATP-binding cassette domain-containing protein [Aliarcobacter butzleri]MDN5123091.1 ATP-binding cassette domain-containing protein [Aliarcobacter butzleri]
MAEKQVILGSKKLYYQYKNSQKPIINNLNFELYAQSKSAIIGQSGCGKSTLLKLLAPLIQPNSGEVFNNSKTIGYMFQDAYLYPWLNVYQNVVIGLKILKKPIIKEEIIKLLTWLGLEEYINNKIIELSGGQRQRVSLARTLAISPEVLLLDEPFSSLDPDTTRVLCEDINEYCEKNKATLLIVTHNYEEAKILANDIYRFEKTPFGETYLESINKESLTYTI